MTRRSVKCHMILVHCIAVFISAQCTGVHLHNRAALLIFASFGSCCNYTNGVNVADDDIQPLVERRGKVDDKVSTLLETTAPPSFSRHHTGYTIDVACDGIGLAKFEATPCYRWLAVDNYKNAKTLGWIPSYPKDSPQQGPNPEPWEFVWVGKDALTEYVAETP